MGEKIKELREAKGWSQGKLTELIGISDKNLVSCWETGKCEPRAYNCLILAEVFNISLDELFCRDFKGEK